MTIRAIMVDDEPLALIRLRQQLERVGGVRIEAECTRVDDALARVAELHPDVVFLDIEMPEQDGLETAEHIHRLSPGASVVFVTAYHEYALRAFEINAVDYILKPVNTDRLRMTVTRLARLVRNEPAPEPNPRIAVHCFQHLRIDGVELSWRTIKARELFAYFIHRRGEPLRKDFLVELLWPDLDMKKGYTQLYSAVYQVRRTLAGSGLSIESTMEGYRLDLKGIPLDVEQWEAAMSKAPPLAAGTLKTHWSLLEQYQGDYLAEYDYMWAEAERERLRTLWYTHAMQLGAFLSATGAHEQAIQVHTRILERLPFLEEVYWRLIQNYDAMSDRKTAERYYEKLRSMLQEEFGTPPREEIEAWARAVGAAPGPEAS